MGNRGSKKEYHLSMFGLDDSGKTTILYQMKYGSMVTTIPTIGINNERIVYRGRIFSITDVGGGPGLHGMRSRWPEYTENINGIIYVIDSCNRDRIEESKEELFGLLESVELNDQFLLCLANCKDKQSSMTTEEIEQKMELNHLKIPWKIQFCDAKCSEGLEEGLKWILEVLEFENFPQHHHQFHSQDHQALHPHLHHHHRHWWNVKSAKKMDD
mmetsp:Transcript_21570/g.29630  ORF Transcript_21570/g.29630 Transcript_21570/m.29630 type:complete len:214 (+) Transcript_21570:26-667(+)